MGKVALPLVHQIQHRDHQENTKRFWDGCIRTARRIQRTRPMMTILIFRLHLQSEPDPKHVSILFIDCACS
jgi:hypothetical protein